MSLLSPTGSLDIDSGSRKFLNAYDVAVSRSQRFHPGPIYRAVIGAISQTTSCFAKIDGRLWHDEAMAQLAQATAIPLESEGGAAVTAAELDTLLQWLRDWGFNLVRHTAELSLYQQNRDLDVFTVAVSRTQSVPSPSQRPRNPRPRRAPPSLADALTDLDRCVTERRTFTAATRYYLENGLPIPDTMCATPTRPDLLRGTHACWNPDCPSLTRRT